MEESTGVYGTRSFSNDWGNSSVPTVAKWFVYYLLMFLCVISRKILVGFPLSGRIFLRLLVFIMFLEPVVNCQRSYILSLFLLVDLLLCKRYDFQVIRHT